MSEMVLVLIEVVGGIAEVTERAPMVDTVVIDWDNLKGEPPHEVQDVADGLIDELRPYEGLPPVDTAIAELRRIVDEGQY